MHDREFTYLHALALIVAFFGAILWAHIPSIYIRAMYGSGNHFSMVELWESMLLVRTLTPWVYDNSLVDSLPFLHKSMNMSELFLKFLGLGYASNLAHAWYQDSFGDRGSFAINVAVPSIAFPGIIVVPYVFLTLMALGILQVLSAPIIFTGIFVIGDYMQLVTLLAYLGIGGVVILAGKIDDA